jgi:hypothetical protein
MAKKKKEEPTPDATQVADTKSDAASEAPTDEEAPPEKHPIAQAISTFLDSVRDIESLARIYVPLSYQRRRKLFNQIERDIQKNIEYLKTDDHDTRVMIMTRLLDAIERFNRLSQSKVPQMLQSSLFLGMFSAYDIFTGELLTAIYQKRPELFRRVNRSIPVSEILEYSSFDELRGAVLQDEIDAFRRKSYVEQFGDLEATFGLKLRAFEVWPQFVECSQRRNLLTHCGGIVSEQYLRVCSKEGYVFDPPVEIGARLELSDKYFLSACELMMEVGFELGQTLWRKVFPDEMNTADGYLNSVIYEDCLRLEEWDRAVIFGEFAVGQKNILSDVSQKICTINYAIGLKFAGRAQETKKVLSEVDWSGAAMDFQLAEAVLTDRYEDAAKLMKKIGKKGQFVEEPYYHQWPLFHEFRKTDQFLNTYEKIYGHPFAVELQRAATKTQAATKVQLEKKGRESDPEPDNEKLTKEQPSESPNDNSAVVEPAKAGDNLRDAATE